MLKLIWVFSKSRVRDRKILLSLHLYCCKQTQAKGCFRSLQGYQVQGLKKKSKAKKKKVWWSLRHSVDTWGTNFGNTKLNLRKMWVILQLKQLWAQSSSPVQGIAKQEPESWRWYLYVSFYSSGHRGNYKGCLRISWGWRHSKVPGQWKLRKSFNCVLYWQPKLQNTPHCQAQNIHTFLLSSTEQFLLDYRNCASIN